MTIRPWRRTAQRTVLRDRWIHIRAEAWETGSGALLDPWYVHERPDWVHVVALTPDDRLVLVRQFRPGAGTAILELPGGLMDPAETDPAAAAMREFAEETGFAAASHRLVAAMPAEPAHSTNRVHFVLALGARPDRAPHPDDGEEIAVELHPVATVLEGLPAGFLGHAGQVGGLLLALRAAGRIGF